MAEVEAALGKLVPAGTEVLGDSRGGRILVRGTATAHQLVEESLRTLDRPAAAVPPAAPAVSGAKSVLKSYRVDSAEAATLAQRLRGELQGAGELRIAADQRTGQLLVLASPETHARVAARLGRGGDAAALAAGRHAGTPAGKQGSPTAAALAPLKPVRTQDGVTQPVTLKNATVPQMARGLQEALENRLQPVTTTTSDARRFRVQLGGDLSADVILDGSSNQVVVQGTPKAVETCARLVQALDAVHAEGPGSTQLLPIKTSKTADLERVAQAVQGGRLPGETRVEEAAAAQRPGGMLAMMLRPDEQRREAAGGSAPAGAKIRPVAQESAAAEAPGAGGDAAAKIAEKAGLVGPVQIEMLDGLDVLIIRGNQRDVDQVMQIIQQIERLSTETEPVIELYRMQHVDSESMGALINQLYTSVFQPRQGSVTITPLSKPNALLVIGRGENVKTALELIKRLDQAVPADALFQVFSLRHAPAATAFAVIENFFAARGSLGTRARVTADARSNALIVQASPRDLAEVAELIKRIDTTTSEAVNELRVFELENSLASELAVILQNAIAGQPGAGRQPTAGAPTGVGTPGALGAVGGLGAAGFPGATAGQPTTAAGAAGRIAEQKTSMLRFVTVDAQGRKVLNSGILTDVRITADVRANALLVSAPAESMELIEALIRELDGRPAAQAQIKVFTVVNGDVLSLVEMLQSLFGQATTGALGGMLMQTGAGEGESSLVPLRFAVDARTNSLIASGSQGDLAVVEAILLRLDESDTRHRKSTVYRLKNAPSTDVALAINQFLQSERQVQQLTPGVLSPFEQLDREVVVVSEPVSNSLIVSATARFYEEIRTLVEQLDKRPPMVMIQVLIGQVALNNTNEFGMELGLQDSILFDRSILGNISTITNTVVTSVPGTSGQTVTQTNQNIVSATNTPGFAFNNQPLGNSGSTQAINSSAVTGSQGLTNFAVGRVNNQLGYGGFVFSASSESVSVLIRALQECRRLDVLSRPQVMTLDNQPAFIQVGQRVPRITSTEVSTVGQQINRVTLDNVGLILRVVPRISPDGLVVMEIDAENSELGPEAEGIPISILTNGQVIRSPRINTTTTQTTVSAVSGQTVVLGGLITKSKTEISRRVPYLSDVPILGALFRYDSKISARSELLIIMTPHVVQGEEDAQRLKQVEASRMSWCLADVVKLHGDPTLRKRTDDWPDAETRVVYPDRNSTTLPPVSPTPADPKAAPETLPTPAAVPGRPKPQGIRVEDEVPSVEKPSSPGGGTQLRLYRRDNAQAPAAENGVLSAGYNRQPAVQAAPPAGAAGSVVPAYAEQPSGAVPAVTPAYGVRGGAAGQGAVGWPSQADYRPAGGGAVYDAGAWNRPAAGPSMSTPQAPPPVMPAQSETGGYESSPWPRREAPR